MKYYSSDLHIHSCLSPCADDDMTPANIAGMGHLNGLEVMALTDHNSSKNCPAFFHHAKKYGIIPVPGMELTTSEDVHLICLFESLEDAMEFDSFVYPRLPDIENRKDIFGSQLILGSDDEVMGEENKLLLNATDISIDEAYAKVFGMGGVCLPAHIDRDSNGILAVLGFFPPEPRFTAFELRDDTSLEKVRKNNPMLNNMKFIVSSDSHNLFSISETGFRIPLDDEPYSSGLVRKNLIGYLREAENG